MYNNYYPYYPKSHDFLSGFKKVNWSSFLDGTQKTLSIINQAIPVIYQVKPIITNAKTAFKVVNALKDESKVNTTKKENIRNIIRNNNYSNNSPTYFL